VCLPVVQHCVVAPSSRANGPAIEYSPLDHWPPKTGPQQDVRTLGNEQPKTHSNIPDGRSCEICRFKSPSTQLQYPSPLSFKRRLSNWLLTACHLSVSNTARCVSGHFLLA
jgi:hypothetical protein